MLKACTLFGCALASIAAWATPAPPRPFLFEVHLHPTGTGKAPTIREILLNPGTCQVTLDPAHSPVSLRLLGESGPKNLRSYYQELMGAGREPEARYVLVSMYLRLLVTLRGGGTWHDRGRPNLEILEFFADELQKGNADFQRAIEEVASEVLLTPMAADVGVAFLALDETTRLRLVDEWLAKGHSNLKMLAIKILQNKASIETINRYSRLLSDKSQMSSGRKVAAVAVESFLTVGPFIPGESYVPLSSFERYALNWPGVEQILGPLLLDPDLSYTVRTNFPWHTPESYARDGKIASVSEHMERITQRWLGTLIDGAVRQVMKTDSPKQTRAGAIAVLELCAEHSPLQFAEHFRTLLDVPHPDYDVVQAVAHTYLARHYRDRATRAAVKQSP